MFKIGIVGAGIIAPPHKRAVLNHPDAELVAVCDIDISKARALCEGTNAVAYEDYKTMASEIPLDAVILNLPHYLHCPVAVYFLERGISVLVEKPMANSARECEAMADAAKRSGAKLAVGHLQRYYECYREIKRIIADGRLGELCQITETRNTDYFTGRPEWFLDKERSGGGIVMNYCAHTLDKLFFLIDSKVTRVCANVGNRLNDKNVEAQAQVLLRFDCGISAALSYCASRIDTSYETVFYFTDGIARVESGVYLSLSQKGKPFERVELDYKTPAIAKQFAEFVKLLEGGEADIADCDYGARVIDVIEEIFRVGE